MKTRGALAALIFVGAIGSGCGSSAEECPGMLESGGYLIQFEQRSGTCPEYIESTGTLEAGEVAFGNGCTTTFLEHDACGESFEHTCPQFDSTGTETSVTTLEGSLDYLPGSVAQGIVTMTIDLANTVEAGPDCSGTFDVTISPL